MINALILLAVLFLAGCVTWPKDTTAFLHVNSRADAIRLGNEWMSSGPGRSWSNVAFTGSMRPILNGGEILLLQAYTGQPLSVGQIVSFYRDAETPRCLHRIIEIKNGAAYLSGDANRYSDGWFPLTRINFVVARVLTFPR